MKIKILAFGSLVVVTVLSFGIVYSFNFRKTSQDNPTETVVNFCSLMEKSDKKEMENFVTTHPKIYWKQIHERVRRKQEEYRSQNNIQKPPVKEEPNNDPNILKEDPNSEVFPQQDYKNKAELLDNVCHHYFFTQKRSLKEINRVWEKGNQARVEVVLGSKDSWFSLPTNFFLYKEDDGKWRIFAIQSIVLNDEYAR